MRAKKVRLTYQKMEFGPASAPVAVVPQFPEWRNAKWVASTHKQISVDVKLGQSDSDWVSYCVDPVDPYCAFDAAAFFEHLVASGQVAEYVPPTLDELRANWALQRLDLKTKLAEMELLDEVDDNIGTQTQGLRLEWREGSVIKRLSPLSTKIMEWTGLSEEQYDELFRGKA